MGKKVTHRAKSDVLQGFGALTRRTCCLLVKRTRCIFADGWRNNLSLHRFTHQVLIWRIEGAKTVQPDKERPSVDAIEPTWRN